MKTLSKLQKLIPSSETASRKKNDRALFLSPFMKKVSGEFGKKLVNAFVSGDKAEFEKLWGEVTQTMSSKIGSETASSQPISETATGLQELAFALVERAALKEVFALLTKNLAQQEVASGPNCTDCSGLYLVYVPTGEVVAGPLVDNQSRIWDAVKEVIEQEQLVHFRVTDRPEEFKQCKVP